MATTTKINGETKGRIDPTIVSKLRFNDTPVLTLSDGRQINVGTERLEGDYLVHWTGKGLREIHNPILTEEQSKTASYLKNQSEEYLMEHGFMAKTPLASIVGINRDVDYDEF